MGAEAAWHMTPEGRRLTQREFERALKLGILLCSAGLPIPPSGAKVLAETLAKAKTKANKGYFNPATGGRSRACEADRGPRRRWLPDCPEENDTRRSEQVSI